MRWKCVENDLTIPSRRANITHDIRSEVRLSDGREGIKKNLQWVFSTNFER